MGSCECLTGCIFFNDKMSGMPVLADRLKNKYCRGDNRDCARHMVMRRLGKGKVPADLFPNQHDRANTLIGA